MQQGSQPRRSLQPQSRGMRLRSRVRESQSNRAQDPTNESGEFIVRRNTRKMPNQQGNFITAIDVGSAKTCALLAEVTDSGLRYRGHGVAESRGSRKGIIVDLDKAVAAIQKAAEAAEDIAGAPVEHATV